MTRSVIALVAAATLVGCTSGSGQVKLGVDVAPIQAVPSDPRTDGTDPASSALDITRVRVLVAIAKVGYAGGKDSSDDSAEAGPYAVELTADEIKNGARREFDLGTLPTGTYGGAEIEIDSINDRGASTDASFADFLAAGASVLIDGTFGDKDFQFAGHFLAEQGTDGEVTIDETTPVTLDMTVDPSTWFMDATGTAADPSDATQHEALAVAICKTLDTQPQSGPVGGGGKRGGGGEAHCVEQAP